MKIKREFCDIFSQKRNLLSFICSLIDNICFDDSYFFPVGDHDCVGVGYFFGPPIGEIFIFCRVRE